MTAADQPTTEPSAREVVESEVWAWLNRHDAPWSPSRLKVLDLTDAIEKALAPAPQPAADTEQVWASEWADYFSHREQTAGTEPLMVGEMVAMLRGPKPFGIAKGGAS